MSPTLTLSGCWGGGTKTSTHDVQGLQAGPRTTLLTVPLPECSGPNTPKAMSQQVLPRVGQEEGGRETEGRDSCG